MNPDRIYQQLVEAGEAWADAEAAAAMLEETRKSVLAKCMQDAEGGSVASKEMNALASEDYEKHVKDMVDARKAANKARVKYDSGRVLAELRRSQESTRRAEMNLR